MQRIGLLLALLVFSVGTPAEAKRAICEAISADGQLRAVFVAGHNRWDSTLYIYANKGGKWIERFQAVPMHQPPTKVEGIKAWRGILGKEKTGAEVYVQTLIGRDRHRKVYDDRGNSHTVSTNLWEMPSRVTGSNQESENTNNPDFTTDISIY